MKMTKPLLVLLLTAALEPGCAASVTMANQRAFSYYLPDGSVLAGLFLYLFTAIIHEFNWGVPQYRAVWMPYFLALGGAFAMVLAYQLNGRLGPVRALLVWLPVQLAMTLFGTVTRCPSSVRIRVLLKPTSSTGP